MGKLQPKLRFPEFKDEWINLSLKDCANFHNNKRIPLKDSERNKLEKVYPYYGASGIIDYVDNYLFDGEFILLGEDGANILTRSSRLVFIAKGKFWVNNHAHVFCAKNNFNNYFLSESLEKIDYSKYNSGTAQPKLNSKVVSGLPLNVPSLQEQTKIAEFLGYVDKQLELLNTKKEKLSLYKKGVMQQLFSQQLRFKEDNGNNYPKWEEKILGEVATSFNGLTGKTAKDFGEGKKYIQYKQIFDKPYINIDDCGLVKIAKNEKQNQCKIGDVFFTVSSETKEEIGMSSVLETTTNLTVYLNSFCFGVRFKDNVLIPQFSRFYFRNQYFRKNVIVLAQGSTRFNLSKINFMKLKITIPTIEEQVKIANFLSAIDKQIETLETEITKTEVYKKGLLQQMFV